MAKETNKGAAKAAPLQEKLIRIASAGCGDVIVNCNGEEQTVVVSGNLAAALIAAGLAKEA